MFNVYSAILINTFRTSKQNLFIIKFVYICIDKYLLMEILLYACIGSAAAYSFWVWCGSPNSETGEYSTDMIFSFIGKWLLIQLHETQNKLYKLPLCPYCLSVWIAFGGAIISQSLLCSIFAAACTAPFVSLFMFIHKNL